MQRHGAGQLGHHGGRRDGGRRADAIARARGGSQGVGGFKSNQVDPQGSSGGQGEAVTLRAQQVGGGTQGVAQVEQGSAQVSPATPLVDGRPEQGEQAFARVKAGAGCKVAQQGEGLARAKGNGLPVVQQRRCAQQEQPGTSRVWLAGHRACSAVQGRLRQLRYAYRRGDPPSINPRCSAVLVDHRTYHAPELRLPQPASRTGSFH
jgi:hypothetical protein